MTATNRITRLAMAAAMVLTIQWASTASHAGPPMMAKPMQPTPGFSMPIPGPKVTKKGPTLKLAKPFNPSLLGQQPKIIPGIGGMLKPVPGPKPNPNPGPNPGPNKPNPGKEWWLPLTRPQNWMGLLDRPHGRPWHPGHHPDPWHNHPQYEPEPMPVDPGWAVAPEPELPENPLGGTIGVFNPEETKTVMRFRIEGKIVQLEPGQVIELPAGRQYVIEFHRGGSFGNARYGMAEGLFWFKRTDRGWELYNGPYEEAAPQSESNAIPQNEW